MSHESRPARTSFLAIFSLILAVLFLPVGASAFFGAGCVRGLESGGAVYVRAGEELPREIAPIATRLVALAVAVPEGFALLLSTAARRRIKRSGGRLGGSEVASVAAFVAIFALLLFVPAFACGGRLGGVT